MNQSTIDETESTHAIPHYRVGFRETLAIIMGAIVLTSAGIAGVGTKLLTNMFDPYRAEAIANSLIDYQIPGKAQGVVGVNIGAEKFAIIKNFSQPPDVVLFVGKSTTEQVVNHSNSVDLSDVLGLQNNVDGEFTVTAIRTENLQFCGIKLPVQIRTGQQTFAEQVTPLPATEYTAKIVKDKFEHTVQILAVGKDAPAKAEQVFKSVRCKF